MTAEVSVTLYEYVDSHDYRLYVMGNILNLTDHVVSPMPFVGLTTDPASSAWVRRYRGVLADSVVVADGVVYQWRGKGIRTQLGAHEHATHLTVTDDVRSVGVQPLYWYFWIESGRTSAPPRVVPLPVLWLHQRGGPE